MVVGSSRCSSGAMRVAVVGAGPAGLAAAKHAQDAHMECTVFEQTGAVGGTWQYTDCVGNDSYGIPVHTSMYRDLRINLPKEVVAFPGVPHQETEESYLTSEHILSYLNRYADMFSIRSMCKFYHHVKNISREGTEWEVAVVDLPTQQQHTYTFDAVFICNGLNNNPFTPKLSGYELFKGTSMHSHDYRCPEPFAGQSVLIVGCGPSALDISLHISKCANKVFLSHHSDRLKAENVKLPDNVVNKPDVRRLTDLTVEFMDNSVEPVDTIVYCTGYNCNYSFLDSSCDIAVDDGLVFPLYKHFINANHPSMCILGNLCYSMQFPTFDFQVRFFIKALADNKILPSKEEMLKNIQDHAQKKLVDGSPKKTYFRTTAEEDAEYYADLAAMAGIEPLPRVLTNIHSRAVTQIYDNFPLFRTEKYKILDDENFVVSAA